MREMDAFSRNSYLAIFGGLATAALVARRQAQHAADAAATALTMAQWQELVDAQAAEIGRLTAAVQQCARVAAGKDEQILLLRSQCATLRARLARVSRRR